MKRTFQIFSVLLIGLLINTSAFAQKRGGISDDPQSKGQLTVKKEKKHNRLMASGPCKVPNLKEHLKNSDDIVLNNLDTKQSSDVLLSIAKNGDLSFLKVSKKKDRLSKGRVNMAAVSKKQKNKTILKIKKGRRGKTVITTADGKLIGNFVLRDAKDGSISVTCQ